MNFCGVRRPWWVFLEEKEDKFRAHRNTNIRAFCLLHVEFYDSECSKRQTLEEAFGVMVDFSHSQVLLKLR